MIPFAICGGRLFFNRPFAVSREKEPDIELFFEVVQRFHKMYRFF